jgi:GTP-binding protein
MYNWILQSGVEYIIVATKADKVSKAEVSRNLGVIRKTLNIPDDRKIYPVSASKKTGIPQLWEAIDSFIMEDDDAVAENNE